MTQSLLFHHLEDYFQIIREQITSFTIFTIFFLAKTCSAQPFFPKIVIQYLIFPEILEFLPFIESIEIRGVRRNVLYAEAEARHFHWNLLPFIFDAYSLCTEEACTLTEYYLFYYFIVHAQ